MAATGASVNVFDLSTNQLAQDRLIAEREGLESESVQSDMAGLSAFPDSCFGLIIHPVPTASSPM